MVAGERVICASSALVERGDGVRFEVQTASGVQPAFVVRYDGVARAFINRCKHVPVELDWEPGRFFDITRLYLICAVHGAHYEPESGRCVMGPCKGARLEAVAVFERDGKVYLKE